MNLLNYTVLPFEPLHDLKGHIANLLSQLPSVITQTLLKSEVQDYLDNFTKQVIQVKKLVGLPLPALELLASYPVNKRIICTYELNYIIPKIYLLYLCIYYIEYVYINIYCMFMNYTIERFMSAINLFYYYSYYT